MIIGALTGFVVWFLLIMVLRFLCAAYKMPIPPITFSGLMVSLGFAAVGALVAAP